MVQPLNSSLTSSESALQPLGGPLGWTARDVPVGPYLTWMLVRMPLPDLLLAQLRRPFRTRWFLQSKAVAPFVNPALTELLRLVGHRHGGLFTSNNVKRTGRSA
jgi:hypothetical protein